MTINIAEGHSGQRCGAQVLGLISESGQHTRRLDDEKGLISIQNPGGQQQHCKGGGDSPPPSDGLRHGIARRTVAG